MYNDTYTQSCIFHFELVSILGESIPLTILHFRLNVPPTQGKSF